MTSVGGGSGMDAAAAPKRAAEGFRIAILNIAVATVRALRVPMAHSVFAVRRASDP
jgi:hypothetical protein